MNYYVMEACTRLYISEFAWRVRTEGLMFQDHAIRVKE